jgi:ABC-type multidrug transport system ATPase subunit
MQLALGNRDLPLLMTHFRLLSYLYLFTSLPRNTPNINAHIDTTLRSLGLQDVANNRIGTPLQRGISGGQKRRVTIACSVIARPRVLVLDEPTSGLDSGSAQEVMASSKCQFHSAVKSI